MASVNQVPEGDLDWPVDSVDLTGVTELRVHGVGGTLPTAMLDDHSVRQVSGDIIAGMWRGSDRSTTDGKRWHREAYSWGGLTSRAFASALWLVLLPFALINLAGWMALGRPRRKDQPVDWRVGYQQSLLRAIALAATWTYVLFAAQIAMDLGAWQCTQVATCRLQSWPKAIAPADAVSGHPVRAVVLAASLPLLLIAGLQILTARSKRRYESYPFQLRTDQEPDFTPARATLFSRSFWQGGAYAGRSHRLHLLSSVVLVGLLLVTAAGTGGYLAPQVRAATWACGVTLGVAMLLAGWDWARRRLLTSRVSQLVTLVIAFGLLIWAATLAWLQPAPPPADPAKASPGIMPGIMEVFYVLIVSTYVLAVLHGVVAVAGRIAAHRPVAAMPRPAGRGLPLLPGPFTTVSLAIWVLFAVWAGYVLMVAGWLSPVAVAENNTRPEAPLNYPTVYEAVVELTVTGVLAIAVLVLAILLVRYFILRLSGRRHGFPALRKELEVWSSTTLPSGQRATQPRRDGQRWLGMVQTRQWLTNLGVWIEYTLSFAALIFTAAAIIPSIAYGWHWLHADLLWAVAALVALCCGLSMLVWLTAEKGARSSALRWLKVGAGTIVVLGTSALVWWGVQPAIAAFDQRPKPSPLPGWLGWLTAKPSVTTTLLSVIPVASILLVRQALRNPNTRRLVGIAWDVATFWPRSFHPLAPPSYAERSVPELEIRLRTLLAHGAVIVAGHSQGAVVCAAALAQLDDLPDEQRNRLSVVTYGNPTAYLYMRWFPHYVYDDLIHTVQGDSGLPWVNFYRHTDYIGLKPLFGHVDGEEPAVAGSRSRDEWLPDPPTDWYRLGDSLPSVRGHGHGGYERQSPFAAHITSEVTRLSPPESTRTGPSPAAVFSPRPSAGSEGTGTIGVAP
jgi:hypothetical protein